MDKGLSPRVRGNHSSSGQVSPRQGSIPACAGEPSDRALVALVSRVYPRVCGGTALFEQAERFGDGLSPRVRGNRFASTTRATPEGSIPACAGEPGSTTDRQRIDKVYPRVCGGTSIASATHRSPCGLSPRVRGNLRHAEHRLPERRSIPACAGEPSRRRTV